MVILDDRRNGHGDGELRRALTVIVASLVMSALVIGPALALMDFEDSSAVVLQAQYRDKLLQADATAFELSLRSAAIVYLDTYAMSISIVTASGEIASVISAGLGVALENVSFISPLRSNLDRVSAGVSAAADGSLVIALSAQFEVSDSYGDSLSVQYSASLPYGLKILGASSLVLSQNELSLEKLSSMNGSSLEGISALNGSRIDGATGLTVVTRLFASQPGSVELLTFVADGGSCQAISGFYSYVVELDVVVPLSWSQ